MVKVRVVYFGAVFVVVNSVNDVKGRTRILGIQETEASDYA